MNQCKSCGKIIILKRPRDKDKIFCNRKCAAQRHKKFKECPVCKTQFVFLKHKRSKFCSTICHNISKKSTYTKECIKCGKSFILNNRAYEDRGGGIFCSVSCKSRKYNVNENFFENIDDEIKAYWLGFLMGDGYQNGYEIVVNLSEKDVEHLYYFKKHIDSEHPINNNVKNTASLRIGSKKLCESLKKLGCIQAKTFCATFPLMQSNFERHFIRGVFDADGCMYVSKKWQCRWSIYSASPPLLNSIIIILKNNNINCRLVKSTQIEICKKTEIRKLYDFIYNESTICLNRKKLKFIHGISKGLGLESMTSNDFSA